MDHRSTHLRPLPIGVEGVETRIDPRGEPWSRGRGEGNSPDALDALGVKTSPRNPLMDRNPRSPRGGAPDPGPKPQSQNRIVTWGDEPVGGMEATAGGGETVDGRVDHRSTHLRPLPIGVDGVETRIDPRGEPWSRGRGEGNSPDALDALGVKTSPRNPLMDRNPRSPRGGAPDPGPKPQSQNRIVTWGDEPVGGMEATAGGGETVDGRVDHRSTHLRPLPIGVDGVETRIDPRGEPWSRGRGEGNSPDALDALGVKTSPRNPLMDRNPRSPRGGAPDPGPKPQSQNRIVTWGDEPVGGMEATAGGGETVDGRVDHRSTHLRPLPIGVDGVEIRIDTRGEPWVVGSRGNGSICPGDELEVKNSPRNHLGDRNP